MQHNISSSLAMVRNGKMNKKISNHKQSHRNNLLSVTVRRRCHNGHPILSTARIDCFVRALKPLLQFTDL